jgi:hypothetical protein
MTATCPECLYSESSDSHRGGRIGPCPRCGTRMRAHTAGRAKGRYLCPVAGEVVTLGLRSAAQLEAPVRLVFIAGADALAAGGRRDQPDRYEQEKLRRAGGLVLGPGCVVSSGLEVPQPGSYGHGRAGAYLVPAPDSSPLDWFVNEPVTYRKCGACPGKVVAGDATRLPGPWAPRRAFYRARRGNAPTSPGPHPAGTYACPDCDPRRAGPGLF